jgi:hypothetical protein
MRNGWLKLDIANSSPQCTAQKATEHKKAASQKMM